MTLSNTIRHIHRWLSIAFTVAVLINIGAMVLHQSALWIGLLALMPLIVLLVTGLYMFVRPHLGGRRAPAAAE